MKTPARNSTEKASGPMVHIVVVTHQGRRWIGPCLESIYGNTDYRPFDVAVVDNGSSDGTCEYVRTAFPQVDLISLGRNMGFGYANNVGICRRMKERPGYVMLLNQDTTVQGRWLSEMVRIVAESDGLGALMPTMVKMGQEELDPHFARVLASSDAFLRDALLNEVAEFYPVRSAIASAVLLSNDMIRTVGLFDPIFFMYGEDTDLFRRAQYHGFDLGVATRARVRHWHSEASVQDAGGRAYRRALAVVVAELKNPLAPVHHNTYRALRWAAAETVSSALNGRIRSATCHVAAATRAHLARPWRLVDVELAGGSDLLIGGRPQALFPGQTLMIVGRGTPDRRAPVRLSIEQAGDRRVIEAPPPHRIESALAPRVYGQIATDQLEQLQPSDDRLAPAFARHFRVVGRTSSLVMLEGEWL